VKQALHSLRRLLAAAAVPALAIALAGCASSALDTARYQFYAGQYERADETLTSNAPASRDRVLHLMERGTIRQAEGNYEASSGDFIDAFNELEAMTAVQVGQDSASFVINDNVRDFRGAPFERTFLHVFTAKDHLAEGHWEDAAVEARRTIASLQPAVRGDYPEDAYSRYVAGFCLEMIDDWSNARLQYRLADEIAADVAVDPVTGRLSATGGTATATAMAWPSPDGGQQAELVCFVMIGRSPEGSMTWRSDWQPEEAMYAELYSGDKLLGRSFSLADTVDLAFKTEQKEALRRVAKTAARIVIKESISQQLEEQDEALGALARIILFGLLERPDVRRWETLPRWLQVARVPCPTDLKDFEVRFKAAYGGTVRTLHVTAPIARHGNIFVSFCRDTPAIPKPE
jgi:hypothetical protein